MRWYSVPRYRFTIRDTDHLDDEEGMILPDDGTAREYAIQIIDELRKDDQTGWIGHTMEVAREGRVVWRGARGDRINRTSEILDAASAHGSFWHLSANRSA